MSDVAKWKVDGAVATLRTEVANWDLGQEEWQPARYLTFATFHADGKISESDFHNPDGSVARSKYLYDQAGRLAETQFWMNDGLLSRVLYSYDNAGRHVQSVHVNQDGGRRDSETCSYDISGRKTKVHFLSLQKLNATFFAVDGTEQLHGAQGATTMTITYDERDLSSEVVFHDARHILLRQVIFVRDSAGRLLSEEIRLSPPEERERAIVTFASLFGPTQTFSKRTFAYDQTGRRLEESLYLGGLAEERTIYRYDDHDNPIEQTNENRTREANLEEDGTLHYSPDQLDIHHTRFEYRYDAKGNWTERIVSIRVEPNPDFQRSNIERRLITYHAV